MDLGGGIGTLTTVKVQTDPVACLAPAVPARKSFGLWKGIQTWVPIQTSTYCDYSSLNLSSSVRYKKVCIVRIVMKTLVVKIYTPDTGSRPCQNAGVRPPDFTDRNWYSAFQKRPQTPLERAHQGSPRSLKLTGCLHIRVWRERKVLK